MKELSKNRKYYGLLTTVLFCSITFQIQAQNKFSDNLKLQVNYHFGVALPEYEFLTYIIDDYVQSVDISLIKETIGKNYWQQIFKYPEYGVSLYYSTLGNNEILGKEIALTGFFRVNFISRSRFRFYNRTGAGFSYVSRKFDFDDNFLNVAVGSHFNMHFNFRLGVNFSLSEKIELNTGLSFDHFSNANISEPNLGLNNLSAYGGLSYRLGQKIEKKKHEIPDHIKKFNIETFLSIGAKHTRALTSKTFLTSSAAFEINWELLRTFRLGTGVDLFYDSSVKTQMEDDGQDYKSAYSFQSGIHLSQALVYNRCSIILQEGIYVFLLNHLNNKRMYNRLIFKYMITEYLSVRIAMKSHLHILDYPELGVGYKF